MYVHTLYRHAQCFLIVKLKSLLYYSKMQILEIWTNICSGSSDKKGFVESFFLIRLLH